MFDRLDVVVRSCKTREEVERSGVDKARAVRRAILGTRPRPFTLESGPSSDARIHDTQVETTRRDVHALLERRPHEGRNRWPLAVSTTGARRLSRERHEIAPHVAVVGPDASATDAARSRLTYFLSSSEALCRKTGCAFGRMYLPSKPR